MRALVFVACAFLALGGEAAAQTPAPPPSDPPEILEIPQTAPAIIRTVPTPPRRARRTASEAEVPQADLPAAVTEDDIAVTSDYRGFNITVFGVNPDRRGRGDIVVVLRGPPQTVSVRRKMRFLGLWVNGPPVRFEEAPSFFAVVSRRPLREIATAQAIWALKLDPAAAPLLASATPEGADPSDYRNALVRLRRSAGLFSDDPNGLSMLESGLFVGRVRLPASAPIGEYAADVYLFRGGRLISSRTRPVIVSRQGVERTLHEFAVHLPFFYGVLTVLLAVGAGWGAALVMRRR